MRAGMKAFAREDEYDYEGGDEGGGEGKVELEDEECDDEDEVE